MAIGAAGTPGSIIRSIEAVRLTPTGLRPQNTAGRRAVIQWLIDRLVRVKRSAGKAAIYQALATQIGAA